MGPSLWSLFIWLRLCFDIFPRHVNQIVQHIGPHQSSYNFECFQLCISAMYWETPKHQQDPVDTLKSWYIYNHSFIWSIWKPKTNSIYHINMKMWSGLIRHLTYQKKKKHLIQILKEKTKKEKETSLELKIILLEFEGPLLEADDGGSDWKYEAEEDEEPASMNSILSFSAYFTRLPCSKSLVRSTDDSW